MFAQRTIILLTLFSQFLTGVKCPVPTYSKNKGFSLVKFNVFQLFPVSENCTLWLCSTAIDNNNCVKHVFRYFYFIVQVLLTIMIMWILCAILTASDYFPVGHPARTDVKIRIIDDSSWFRVPYPGNIPITIYILLEFLNMLWNIYVQRSMGLADRQCSRRHRYAGWSASLHRRVHKLLSDNSKNVW